MEDTRNLWVGPSPTECDLCKGSLKDLFVDGKTRSGFWAILCALCFARQGIGLGRGVGQRYLREGNLWVQEGTKQ